MLLKNANYLHGSLSIPTKRRVIVKIQFEDGKKNDIALKFQGRQEKY